MNQRILLILAALSGLTAVALGAFGAHGLRPHLTDYQIQIYDKAVQYQFAHTLAAIFLCIYYSIKPLHGLLTAAAFMLAGVFCFSGSLYLLATADLTGLPRSIIGPVTPIGGVFFIAGWAVMCYQVARSEQFAA